MVCTLTRDALASKADYVYKKGMVGLVLQGDNIHLEGIVSQVRHERLFLTAPSTCYLSYLRLFYV